MWEKLSGKKTYGIAVLTVLYAVAGWILGYVEPLTAVNLILGALGIGALRNGLPT